MKAWRIAGRAFVEPPPPDWRTRLAARLGERPRRVGEWVELALFGALACMDDAGEAVLPGCARLSVASAHGPDLALRAALAEAREGLPLPLGFLRSQPGQVLPALARPLGWQGDGRCLATRDSVSALALACAEGAPDGLLLGWVEEAHGGRSCWLRLVPAAFEGLALRPGGFAELAWPAVTHLAFDAAQLHMGALAPAAEREVRP